MNQECDELDPFDVVVGAGSGGRAEERARFDRRNKLDDARLALEESTDLAKHLQIEIDWLRARLEVVTKHQEDLSTG